MGQRNEQLWKNANKTFQRMGKVEWDLNWVNILHSFMVY